MVDRMSGRTAIVTGAASGIGAAIAAGLASEGANVVLADLNLEEAKSRAEEITANGGTALALQMNVTDRVSVAEGVRAAAEAFGRIDVVFNNAGMNQPMPFLEVTDANFMAIMKVNALGVLIGTQEAAKQFIAQGGGGKIVNTASIAGRTGYPDFAPYSASKAAVISLIQAAARDLAQHGITVNGFGPGVVATPLWTKLDKDLADMGKADAGFDSMSSGILLGRPAQPRDIVPTAVFLACGDSDYITGQVIPIEGGMILV